MSERDHGGPAFPIPQRDDERWDGGHPDGMTLRDWFAGQALAGAVANLDGPRAISDAMSGINPSETLAVGCYAIADAMLAERERED